ncbi:hypothetical protein JOB18_022425 [Solea senegalensis]|uniref:Uncharacterized protein n=1 Tax=Solea senegalensis TaxID=28829 RepID=A0AAV6S849_SOLSE|nr:hypothetical protein JOB18_022425 [Solea senegalensis]
MFTGSRTLTDIKQRHIFRYSTPQKYWRSIHGPSCDLTTEGPVRCACNGTQVQIRWIKRGISKDLPP